MADVAQLVAGIAVTAKTMGRSPKSVEGSVKEVTQGSRGSWVIVQTSDGEVKTRPALVTLK